MKVWITKYALTVGIIETEGEVCDSANSGSMVQATDMPYKPYFHGKGRQWHDNLSSAQRTAHDMRRAKIRSLEKQLAKMNALDVKVVKRP
jgi:hypothetical protein